MTHRLAVAARARADGSVHLLVGWHPCALLPRLHDTVLELRVMTRAQQAHAATSRAPASVALGRVMQRTLERATRVLVRARRLADAALLAGCRVDAALAAAASDLATFVSELQADVEGWRQEQAEMGASGGSAGPARASRAAMLADEAADLASAEQLARAAGGGASDGAALLALLAERVASLRALEVELPFQAELLRAQMRATREYALPGPAAAACAGSSREHFAYGSTPFGTWAALAACPPVAAALAALRASAAGSGGGERALVAGSSAGWFCLYLALHGRVGVVGYELLPPLHAAAQRERAALLARAAAEGVCLPPIELHCADVLGADLSRVRLVVLASLCWDVRLRQAVHAKLRAECAEGTVVIDYRRPPPCEPAQPQPQPQPAVAADSGHAPSAARATAAQRRLWLVGTVVGRTSWEAQSSLAVLQLASAQPAAALSADAVIPAPDGGARSDDGRAAPVGLTSLPTELLVRICALLPSALDLSRLDRTCRLFHCPPPQLAVAPRQAAPHGRAASAGRERSAAQRGPHPAGGGAADGAQRKQPRRGPARESRLPRCFSWPSELAGLGGARAALPSASTRAFADSASPRRARLHGVQSTPQPPRSPPREKSDSVVEAALRLRARRQQRYACDELCGGRAATLCGCGRGCADGWAARLRLEASPSARAAGPRRQGLRVRPCTQHLLWEEVAHAQRSAHGGTPCVSAGWDHVLAVSWAGRAYAMGTGTRGRLGLGHDHSEYAPALLPDPPSERCPAQGNDDEAGARPAARCEPAAVAAASSLCQLAARARVVCVSAGEMHSLFVMADGTLRSCGNGCYGRLGHGDERDQLSPRLVRGALAGARVVSAAAGSAHSIAVCSDGRLFAWGARSGGRLGLGEPSDSDTVGELATEVELAPALVGALRDGGVRVLAASAGEFHNLALSADGHVYSWGVGLGGRLGHGDEVTAWSPRRIESLARAGARAIALSAGGSHSLVLCEGGRLYACGAGAHGALGTGLEQDELLPAEVLPAAATTAAAGGAARARAWPAPVCRISAGRWHSLAATEDGTAWAWGLGVHGKLGLGDEENRLAPHPLRALSERGVRVRGVSAGAQRSFFWTEGGAHVFTAGFVRGWRSVTDPRCHDGEAWDSLRLPALIEGLRLARPDGEAEERALEESGGGRLAPARPGSGAHEQEQPPASAEVRALLAGASTAALAARERSGHVRVPGLTCMS